MVACMPVSCAQVLLRFSQQRTTSRTAYSIVKWKNSQWLCYDKTPTSSTTVVFTAVVTLRLQVHGIKFQIPTTHYLDMKSMCERLSKACLRKQQLIPVLHTNIGLFEGWVMHGWSGNRKQDLLTLVDRKQTKDKE